MDRMHIRQARPGDYDAIAAVVDDWWGRPDGFLCGILSPSDPDRAYIRFVGVAPQARQRGLGRQLYEEFFRLAQADGRSMVSAVTSPVNAGSIAFHESMGFTVTGPVADYHGPGRGLIVFERVLPLTQPDSPRGPAHPPRARR
jgi:ribosomal protein S18 acetylase RimI-like enzyme